MAAGRRQSRKWATVLLFLAGLLALITGLAAITTPAKPPGLEDVTVGLVEAAVGSFLAFTGALLADRYRAVVASGVAGGTALVVVGSVPGILAGAGALAAGVWAYADPWCPKGQPFYRLRGITALGDAMEKERVGVVFKFFAKPSVAAIRITEGSLRRGDKIQIQGATTDFTTTIESMEIDQEPVESASAGQSVGIKVPDRVRPNDAVYRILE
jgi:putative protease